MPPFPTMWRVGLTFDLPFDLLLGQSILELSVAQCVGDRHDLWPLTYWPEYKWGSSTYQWLSTYQVWSFWGKAFLSYQLYKVWAINMTLTLTFDLLTWISIGIIYFSWTINLPCLKLVGQSIVESSVAQGIGDQHDLWLWPLIIYSSRTIYLPRLKLLGQSVLELSVEQELSEDNNARRAATITK